MCSARESASALDSPFQGHACPSLSSPLPLPSPAQDGALGDLPRNVLLRELGVPLGSLLASTPGACSWRMRGLLPPSLAFPAACLPVVSLGLAWSSQQGGPSLLLSLTTLPDPSQAPSVAFPGCSGTCAPSHTPWLLREPWPLDSGPFSGSSHAARGDHEAASSQPARWKGSEGRPALRCPSTQHSPPAILPWEAGFNNMPAWPSACQSLSFP